MTMKKLIPAVLLSVVLLSGCSYLSKMNPWSSEEDEKVYVAPKTNPFLWQASLDKLSFMPLQTSDVKSGMIVSEWYAVSGRPAEKFKLQVRVVSNELRADCLKVNGYTKQLVQGKWQENPMKKSMLNAIELSILERARVLYQQSLEK